MRGAVQQLSDTLIAELTKALALPQTGLAQRLVRAFFEEGTLRFSKLVLNFDREIERNGTMAGARWLLTHFIKGFEANGAEMIPSEGPLIIASNHPAAYDGMVISACVARPDYRVIIGDVPTYHFLPNLCRHAIFAPQTNDPFGRMLAVRRAIQHLKNGGAILTFPRGGIEPDPAFMPNPDGEFSKWSRSLEIFLQCVPQTRVLVTAVSGVISRKIFRHPITWLRRKRNDKQRLTFMYQMIRQVLSGRELFGLTPQVTFGELLESLHPDNILTEIESAARRTLEKHISHFQIKGAEHAPTK
ncbi:MAG TPA: 1-acyl-sn-glycerol-3-phosphate acyltransferase [Anaerolineales bacterium]|nr:1-acyl-sn-glycerol-3-phosphate acyltransferase [Anaerolineales bacterium]